MTKSDNIKIMMGSETNDIIEKLFESLQKYQERLEESITALLLIVLICCIIIFIE